MSNSPSKVKTKKNFYKDTILPETLEKIRKRIFEPGDFQLKNPFAEKESSEYGACSFELNHLRITFRIAKVTPTKIGQFVTLWKRSSQGPIEPFHIQDDVDFLMIHTNHKNRSGQFVFPKQVLFEKGIVSGKKEGKRGFRVYPSWDKPTNKQALQTQKWQLAYFLENQTNKTVVVENLKKFLNSEK
ncbi:MepB protein [Leptospira santarosai]|nr:MepB protein [Leptospira santarosai]